MYQKRLLQQFPKKRSIFMGVVVSIWLLLLSFWMGQVLAAVNTGDPVTMLQQISTQMLTSLKQNKAQLKTNPQILNRIVQTTLLPYFNLDDMGRSIVGGHYWSEASTQQRTEFIKQFTHFVTRSYADVLASYNDERVLFYPIRGGVAGQSRVQVHSKIERQDGPPVAMDYRLERTSNGWKVYDFSIEGISMVQSYRSQFSTVLAQGGLTGLIQQLQTHNQKLRNDG